MGWYDLVEIKIDINIDKKRFDGRYIDKIFIFCQIFYWESNFLYSFMWEMVC